MARLTFYPLGNADCCLIDLADKKKLLLDFGNQRDPDNPDDKRIDLAEALRKDLAEAERDSYDYVGFTHLDRDHVNRASEFFWFDFSKKYQGEGRARINTLWVPAAVIIEEKPDFEDADVIQAEARYRLREGYGIRVFSGPKRLDAWLVKNGLTPESRARFITNAGELIPGLNKQENGVEFFVHCPFAHRNDAGNDLDRNDDSLVLQATFLEGGRETKLILGSDITHKIWAEIVKLTKRYKNEARLEWDVFKLPHHCSYTGLGPEKGKTKTVPVPEAKWLFEDRGQRGGIVISTSDPIPVEDTDQPPHKQAAAYHEDTKNERDGKFIVTMEHPSAASPEPLIIHIDGLGTTVRLRHLGGIGVITSRSAPRAG